MIQSQNVSVNISG